MTTNETPILPLFNDPWLEPYRAIIANRANAVATTREILTKAPGSLAEFACAHEFYGLHRDADHNWVFREWAPAAQELWLTGDFSDWQLKDPFKAKRLPGREVWELHLPADALRHGQYYRIEMVWEGGRGERLPAYTRRVVQDIHTGIFSAQVWEPEPYLWQNPFTVPKRPLLIYEAHIGMAQEDYGVGTYNQFRINILPRIARAGYNTIQLMAIMEHPYYASFGYQVSNFFAASSRFGTPEELKELIDEAHGLGIAVIMDLVHSHAVKNEREGLSYFDGSTFQYFHNGLRGWHDAWDSRCFDYGKTDVLHFLLSNCRYWLDEFRFDGFRFDGITSMLYMHHGLGVNFTDYSQYYDSSVDTEAWTYCTLANNLIRELRPDAITIAEDVSGMPGLAAPLDQGGAGFGYRMAMGVPDCWFKLARDMRDEDWSVGFLWHELTNHRPEELTVNYVESHDQALVGGKTLLFQLMDAAIYNDMTIANISIEAMRGVALHKLARLATLATSGGGYLNFIGNEFGHPEWIDFPREDNHFSYQYARRQWSLRDNPDLLFAKLADFDQALLKLFTETDALANSEARLLFISENDKILVIDRDPLLVLLNLHSSQSVSDYPIKVPPGTLHGVLNTDESRFGGQNRITATQAYPHHTNTSNNERHTTINIYLPCRTGLILQRT